MAFDWLDDLLRSRRKPPGYAAKTLAAYALGMKARGSIVGVAIDPAADCCEAARRLPADAVYRPEEAPHLPLDGCSRGDQCGCLYRPVLAFPKIGEP